MVLRRKRHFRRQCSATAVRAAGNPSSRSGHDAAGRLSSEPARLQATRVPKDIIPAGIRAGRGPEAWADGLTQPHHQRPWTPPRTFRPRTLRPRTLRPRGRDWRWRRHLKPCDGSKRWQTSARNERPPTTYFRRRPPIEPPVAAVHSSWGKRIRVPPATLRRRTSYQTRSSTRKSSADRLSNG